MLNTSLSLACTPWKTMAKSSSSVVEISKIHAKILGFTASGISILRLPVTRWLGPLVSSGHSCGPVLPGLDCWHSRKRHVDLFGALLGQLSETEASTFFSPKNISCRIFSPLSLLGPYLRYEIFVLLYAGTVHRAAEQALHTTKEWIKLEVIHQRHVLNLMLEHGPRLLHFFVHKLHTVMVWSVLGTISGYEWRRVLDEGRPYDAHIFARNSLFLTEFIFIGLEIVYSRFQDHKA